MLLKQLEEKLKSYVTGLSAFKSSSVSVQVRRKPDDTVEYRFGSRMWYEGLEDALNEYLGKATKNSR